MFHINTYASVTKVSIIKEDLMMMMMIMIALYVCGEVVGSFACVVRLQLIGLPGVRCLTGLSSILALCSGIKMLVIPDTACVNC